MSVEIPPLHTVEMRLDPELFAMYERKMASVNEIQTIILRYLIYIMDKLELMKLATAVKESTRKNLKGA